MDPLAYNIIQKWKLKHLSIKKNKKKQNKIKSFVFGIGCVVWYSDIIDVREKATPHHVHI